MAARETGRLYWRGPTYTLDHMLQKQMDVAGGMAWISSRFGLLLNQDLEPSRFEVSRQWDFDRETQARLLEFSPEGLPLAKVTIFVQFPEQPGRLGHSIEIDAELTPEEHRELWKALGWD